MLSDLEKTQVLNQAIASAYQIVSQRVGVEELKIYFLVQEVAAAISFPWSRDSYVSMYQKLFITQAALCELYFYHEENGLYQLCLNPVSVYLRRNRQMEDQEGLFDNATLALANREGMGSPNVEFFSQFNNFFEIDAERVIDLMQNFWRDYASFEEEGEAYQVLDLPTSATWPEIQRQFRLLASEHHPDKGGKNERFVKIRAAYESLKPKRSYLSTDRKGEII